MVAARCSGGCSWSSAASVGECSGGEPASGGLLHPGQGPPELRLLAVAVAAASVGEPASGGLLYPSQGPPRSCRQLP